MIIRTSRPAFQSYGDPLAWVFSPALAVSTLAVSPPIITTTATLTVTFTGTGTSWLSSPPTFTPSGLAGVTTASLVVISDTQATLSVTTSGTAGTITWTDSSTSDTATQVVEFVAPRGVHVVRLPLLFWQEDYRPN